MKRICFAVFMVSAASLMFEVSLMRLFAIHLWYHFAFMVVSIAMLGTGSAGTLLYVYSIRGKARVNSRYSDEHGMRDSGCRFSSDNHLSSYAVLAGVFILFSYISSNYVPFDPVRFSWEKVQFFYLALFCFLLSLPFLFTGILITAVFIKYNKESASIYGYDLIGAAVGSALVLTVLNITGPEYPVLIASTFCLAGAMLLGGRYFKLLPLCLIMLNVFIFLFNPDAIHVRMSPYKPLPLALSYPGAKHIQTFHNSYSRIDTFTSPAVRFAPGLSLKYPGSLPDQTGLAIDGARIEVITRAGDDHALGFLEYLPSSAGHEIARKERTLVIDPGGGLQLLMAKHYGFKEVYGVESNALLANIITSEYSDFSGGIYNNIRTGYARNSLDGTSYDLIDIPVDGTSVSGLFGISEDYKFTIEAFSTYLESLNKDGLLSISLYIVPPPRTELRILSTITASLELSGIRDAFNRIAAIRSWDSMTILVKKSPFTEKEIRQLKDFTSKREFDLAYYPGIREDETNVFIRMQSNEYFQHFKSLMDNNISRSYMENYVFDIKPVHDDNPFFHYFMRIDNIKPIYEIMGRNWLYFIEEGYLLPVLFSLVFILCILMIVAPLLLKQSFRHTSLSTFITVLVYFSMIGFGFMFIEITLIQKSILLLENPALSTGIVLTSILVSSGAGSLVSFHYPRLCSRWTFIILSLLAGIYAGLHPVLFSGLSYRPLPVKIAILCLSLFPLGFFMGIPFPSGMKLLGNTDRTLIPWAWSVNACTSVLAPVLTTMIAISAGFKTILWLSVLSYVIASLVFSRLRQY